MTAQAKQCDTAAAVHKKPGPKRVLATNTVQMLCCGAGGTSLRTGPGVAGGRGPSRARSLPPLQPLPPPPPLSLPPPPPLLHSGRSGMGSLDEEDDYVMIDGPSPFSSGQHLRWTPKPVPQKPGFAERGGRVFVGVMPLPFSLGRLPCLSYLNAMKTFALHKRIALCRAARPI